MARKDEAVDHFKGGLALSMISQRMGISMSTVIQYLSTKVGEGEIRLVDIYFSWTPSQREFLQESDESDVSGLIEYKLTKEEFNLFHSLRKEHIFRGGMYEMVSELEIKIHGLVRSRLVKEYGLEKYFREGVPIEVRKKCATNQQDDENPVDDLFAYTTLIQLWNIIDKKWRLFESIIPSNYSNKKTKLKRDMNRLNGIRNRVMHPVKNYKWEEDDFVFVRGLVPVFGGYEQSVELSEMVK